MIKERRDVEWEKKNAGKSCAYLRKIPVCSYSVNAFGLEKVRAFSPSPDRPLTTTATSSPFPNGRVGDVGSNATYY